MAYTTIELEIEDPVAVIRLNRPERLNAITTRMLSEIRDAIRTAVADPAVVGIIITGNGRGFCAGGDSEEVSSVTSSQGAGHPMPGEDEVPGLFTYFLEVPKPIVAAVNGVAAGGGLVLALMADIRFASANASFTSVFLKRGLTAEHGITWIVPRLVGPGRALDLIWTSDRIDAKRALAVGLVEYVCEPDELLIAARGYIEKLAGSAAPAAMAETKQMIYGQLGLGYAEALRQVEPVVWSAVARPDANEGVQAFIEKRPPRFERLAQ